MAILGYLGRMRSIAGLLRRDKEARRFFLAYGQSSLGSGAAYVALLLIAYARFRSPWALTLVLLAEFVPPMLLAPIFGAAADRWSRRGCAIAADTVRAGAFVGIAFTSSFVMTVLLALLAGAGTALYKPAVMAGLPEIVGRERLSQATALYGALTEIGFTIGPGAAAVVLLFGGPKILLLVNAGTFALSSAVLATLPFRHRDAAPAEASVRKSLIREARDGLMVVARIPAAGTVIVATSTILLFGGMVNVAELLLAKQLGGGKAGYSLFVAVAGLGVVFGSLVGASGGELRGLVRRFLAGVVLVAAGLVGTAAAPTFASALVPLAALGFGNGMVIVYERLILQKTVAGPLLGRAFGTQVSLDGFAFAASFLCGGAVLTLAPPRTLFLIGGIGAALVWLVARQLFATMKVPDERLPAAEDQGAQEVVAIGASVHR
jgi:MFS family permease